MVVFKTKLVELGFELTLKYLSEDIFESAVICLKDRVLGRKEDRVFAGQAIVKDARAKSLIKSSRLYIAIATPEEGNLKTSNSIGADPSSGVKVTVRVPAPGTLKSVARY